MNTIRLPMHASERLTRIAAVIVVLASFSFLYRDVIVQLVHAWIEDDNYSHGFFIFPLALYFVWERRDRLAGSLPQPSLFGLVMIAASLALLLAGMLGSELFTTRVSILGNIAGAVLFIYGWQHLRVLILPISFLLLMIPIPAILFNQLAFPLQLIASRFGELSLSILGVPVLREGNVIQLANTSLEVVEACSGIRSLISLLTLGLVYGYFAEARIWGRALLAFLTIPVAIIANGLRVALTGIAAHNYGPEVAEGFFHTFSGWLVFLAAFLMLFATQRLIHRLVPGLRPKG